MLALRLIAGKLEALQENQSLGNAALVERRGKRNAKAA